MDDAPGPQKAPRRKRRGPLQRAAERRRLIKQRKREIRAAKTKARQDMRDQLRSHPKPKGGTRAPKGMGKTPWPPVRPAQPPIPDSGEFGTTPLPPGDVMLLHMQLGVRLPVEMIARIDHYIAARKSGNETLQLTRSEAVRDLLDRALCADGRPGPGHRLSGAAPGMLARFAKAPAAVRLAAEMPEQERPGRTRVGRAEELQAVPGQQDAGPRYTPHYVTVEPATGTLVDVPEMPVGSVATWLDRVKARQDRAAALKAKRGLSPHKGLARETVTTDDDDGGYDGDAT